MKRAPRVRRGPTLLLSVLLALAVAAPAGATHRFPDVPDRGVFGREIAWGDSNSLIAGYPDGTFRPGSAVARIEAVVVLFNYGVALDGYRGPEVPPYPATPTLADVRDWADSNGIWGSAANRTRPATRAQVVRYLSRYHTRVDGGTLTGDVSFGDTGSSVYADEVAWAASNGVVEGFADGTFRPNGLVTRGQLVAIVHRYQVAFDGGEPFDGPTPAPQPDPEPEPAPQPDPEPEPGPACSPAYVPCVPGDQGDVDCGDLDGIVIVVVPGVDPFDLDTDDDGIGCESNG